MLSKNNIKTKKTERVQSVKPISAINRISGTPKISNCQIQTGDSRPSLSNFLGAYVSLLSGLGSSQNQNIKHQVILNHFEIEISTGIAGYRNNEFNIKL